jgi:hypothetical protein
MGRIMVPTDHQKGHYMIKVMATIDIKAAVRGEKDAAGKEVESQPRPLEVEADTYELARDELFESIPAGWMIIGGLDTLPHRADTYEPPRQRR